MSLDFNNLAGVTPEQHDLQEASFSASGKNPYLQRDSNDRTQASFISHIARDQNASYVVLDKTNMSLLNQSYANNASFLQGGNNLNTSAISGMGK